MGDTMDKEYLDALTYLQKTSSSGDGNVFDHLTDVVRKVLEERPDGAVDLMETSLLVKRSAFVAPDVALAAASHIPPKALSEATAKAELFVAPEPPIDPVTGTAVEVDPPNEYETEDLLAMAPLFEAVGAGLGKVETVMAALAIKQLGEDPKLRVDTVRFFGKFLGTEGDYYVFEATMKDAAPAEEEGEPEFGRPVSSIPSEESGTGANKHAYFVSSFLGGAFTRLPEVSPLMVTTARSIKKFLTGKLDSEVSAFPAFPGREAEFLRAQVAIIASETVLCPAGLFEAADEDTIDITKVDDFSAPTYSEVSSWAHHAASLNSQGRCTWYEFPPVEGDEEVEQPEPEAVSILGSADDDGEVVEGTAAWTVVCSSCIPGLKHVTYGMRSNKFPGAVAVAKGEAFSNMYVGYGISSSALKPPFPPAVGEEAEEVVESEEAPEPPPPEEPAAEEEAAEE